MVIGQVDGAPEYQFFQVVETLQLLDGTIVAADNGSESVRFYTPSGIFISFSGRSGKGPGEYQNLRILGRYGADSLIAWDPPLRRATILTQDGPFVRTFEAADFGNSYAFFHAASSDGSLLGTVAPGVQPDTLPPGPIDIFVSYIRLEPTGKVDTIGRFRWNQAFHTTGGTFSFTDLPLGRRPVQTARPGEFYYGGNETKEIQRYDMSGRLISILRIAGVARELSRDVVARYIENQVDQAPDSARKESRRRFFAEIDFPSHLPAFSAIRVDVLGNLWAADYRIEESEPFNWRIYSSDGIEVATISTPATFDIREIGSDYVLGVERDEVDVEHIVKYGLVKQ